MPVTLTNEQTLAVDKICHWLDHEDSPTFVLGGYAGTGKTTIARWLYEHIEGREVWFIGPTGKSVAVLRSKLPEGAIVTTAHSFLYRPMEIGKLEVEDKQREVDQLTEAAKTIPAAKFELVDAKRQLEELTRQYEKGECLFLDRGGLRNQPLVVADESSMYDERMEADLRANAARILFIGDCGQLPPVQGADFFTRNAPNMVLEQIHRQAADSPILRLAHAIRKGERFSGWNNDCRRVERVPPSLLCTADVVITGMNATRRKLNRRCREFLKRSSPYPVAGEPLMCLRNSYRGPKLINGVAGVATSDAHFQVRDGERRLVANVAYQGAHYANLSIDPYHFDLYAKPTVSRGEYDEFRQEAQFDFGYAITGHKSQGSEWPHVVVWDDRMNQMDRESRKRWQYTVITRAQKKLTYVSPVL